jgi:hypothetical protein
MPAQVRMSATLPGQYLSRVNSSSYLQKGGGSNASGFNFSNNSKQTNSKVIKMSEGAKKLPKANQLKPSFST